MGGTCPLLPLIGQMHSSMQITNWNITFHGRIRNGDKILHYSIERGHQSSSENNQVQGLNGLPGVTQADSDRAETGCRAPNSQFSYTGLTGHLLTGLETCLLVFGMYLSENVF